MSLIISTIGIIVIARSIAIPYSAKSRVASPNAFASGGTSITSVVSRNERIPAPQSHLFWLFIAKIESLRERILKEWNISHIERVRNAIVVP